MGLFAFLLPWLLLATWGGLLVAWLGGLDELSRVLGMAGPTIHRMAGLTLAGTGALAIVLFFLGLSRPVPLVVPAVFALLPWWLAVVETLRALKPVLASVEGMPLEDRNLLLLQSTAEAVCLRLLGAWFAGALLLALAGALLLAARGHRGESEDPTVSLEKERMLEAALVALLGVVSCLAAFESLQVTETFLAVVSAEPVDRNTLLAQGAEQLTPLRWLRLGALTGITLAVLSLGRRRLARQPRDILALGSLGLVVLLAVGMLRFDARPLASMRDALEQTDAR
jgi:hypothetical protein